MSDDPVAVNSEKCASSGLGATMKRKRKGMRFLGSVVRVYEPSQRIFSLGRTITVDVIPIEAPEMTKEAPSPSALPPIALTFFGWLLPLVTSGLKTITIRDAAEADFFTPHVTTATTLPVYALEDSTRHHPVCYVILRSVQPLVWDEINVSHARSECMSLSRLQSLLREIYPNEKSLYLIDYKVVAMGPLASWTQAGHSLLYFIVGPVLAGLLWLCGLR